MRVSFAWVDSARGRHGEGQRAGRRMQRGASACPQSCMRGGAGTSGRNLLIHPHPLSHVSLPPASCISDVPANSIQALALAARSRRCNNYLRERSSHFAAANRLCGLAHRKGKSTALALLARVPLLSMLANAAAPAILASAPAPSMLANAAAPACLLACLYFTSRPCGPGSKA